MSEDSRMPLPPRGFLERLRQEGLHRYHHRHPFHELMHEGRLTRHQLQQWVVNRYYYQTRLPIKDALILAKSEDPAFRRAWIHRIQDHDGHGPDDGGLALWRRLAQGVGLDEQRVVGCHAVLPGVRKACDGYVALVREATLPEAVASSLTELFAPDVMTQRIAAWERHYPWVDRQALEYFRIRVPRAAQDADFAAQFVLAQATTLEQQDRCVAALIRKTEILRQLLDCLWSAYVTTGEQDPYDRTEPSQIGR